MTMMAHTEKVSKAQEQGLTTLGEDESLICLECGNKDEAAYCVSCCRNCGSPRTRKELPLDDEEDEEGQAACDYCPFVAANEVGLKVHFNHRHR